MRNCRHGSTHQDADWLPLPRFQFCDNCPAFRYTKDGITWSIWKTV
jgi:hypothetical protein